MMFIISIIIIIVVVVTQLCVRARERHTRDTEAFIGYRTEA